MSAPVCVSMLLLTTLVTLVTCDTAPARPNILYILADDVGFGDVSWNNPRMVTPILQRLASQAGINILFLKIDSIYKIWLNFAIYPIAV